MNVSMESSIEEEDGLEKVEKEALDTTIYQPDYVTEVNFMVVIKSILILHSCSTKLTGPAVRRRCIMGRNWETGDIIISSFG